MNAVVLRLAALLLLALAGCASEPGPPSAPVKPAGDLVVPPARGAAPGVVAFEDHQRERALALTRQGRLAAAVQAWEVLALLRPEVGSYRERLNELQHQIDADAAACLARAQQAQKRGEPDAAAPLYLSVLALQPDNATAADALRVIERERNKRNYLGKFSRVTLTRRAMPETEAPAVGASGTSLPDRNELEHASMLADQGETDEAIDLLEKRLGGNRKDAAARQLLSEVYFQKGQGLAQEASGMAAATKAFERSVQLDPGNARARARLTQIKAAAARARGADAAASAPRR